MPVVKPFNNKNKYDAMWAFSMQNKIGRGSGFGFYDMGKAWIGEYNPMGGTYQKRHTGYNNRGKLSNRKRKTYYVRMRDCTPNNPRTPKQQANRQKMAVAVQAWRELSNEERIKWNKAGQQKGRYGFNQFISWKLKSMR